MKYPLPARWTHSSGPEQMMDLYGASFNIKVVEFDSFIIIGDADPEEGEHAEIPLVVLDLRDPAVTGPDDEGQPPTLNEVILNGVREFFDRVERDLNMRAAEYEHEQAWLAARRYEL